MIHDLRLRLQHDAATGLLRAAWRKGQPLSAFQSALEWLMEFSQEHQVTRWLIDMQSLPPLGNAEQTWITEHWFTAITATPVRQLALVLPSEMHNYLVATAPVHDPRLVPPFELNFFTDAASAFGWLMESEPTGEQIWQEWPPDHSEPDPRLA
ncbi:hypothetical protein [Hymenobacter rubripertinctus]|uniref:STAS/SEC14 domain-containing protein n=1 Tax=Hymenobacter rubripertinctus TaxID=2029981 RepID=A0A418QYL1_9BACT|nr:hypothetical protein [Hymenobacter rubripertinctus]RIY10228.1 hypothetical protein D0T11_10265 [Hymenobacter rubripertinctus]